MEGTDPGRALVGLRLAYGPRSWYVGDRSSAAMGFAVGLAPVPAYKDQGVDPLDYVDVMALIPGLSL